MLYRCIIVDDEPLAIEVIRTHAMSLGIFQIVGECHNAVEAYHKLRSEKTDLMFLDIQMPGIKGTDFLKSLVNPPKVILTTAFREYAFESYDLDVVDYLLKPVSYDRFVRAVDKFVNLESRSGKVPAEERFIYLNINKKVHKIFEKDIVYAESIKDYLTIHTVNGDITVKHTISAFEKLLPADDFVRIHRSFIVSVRKIKGFNAHTVDIGLKELPIGQNYQAIVYGKLRYPGFKS